ncbi:glucokinase [Massilia cellulosiltytica]|uniref:glucokinase n=1 Tax=Massilia cellulosiltytica TaxID=2683234 RepID=UPI0039B5BEE6
MNLNPHHMPHHYRLLADIGGTNARFALETPGKGVEALSVLRCADYASLAAAIEHYLASAPVQSVHRGPIHDAAIAIATALDGDLVGMTSHHWTFSIAALRAHFGLTTLLVVNDFTALAMALPRLADDQRKKIGGGLEQPGRPIGLLGPGTGLGVSGLMPAGERWIPLASEGGHATFAPGDFTELGVLQALWSEYGHVSAERLLSGMGLESIHRAMSGETLSAAQITGRALAGDSAACDRTVACFCAVLGTVAGNLALTLGATGGIYIGGGIVGRLGVLFERSQFRARFEAKGRMAPYMAKIPTFLITEEYPAFLGVSALLDDHLANHH